MRRSLLSVAACCVALAGCGSTMAVTRTEDPILVMVTNNTSIRYNKDVRVSTSHLAGPPSTHWALLDATFTNLGLPITARDSAEHTIASQNTQLSGRFAGEPVSRVVDCGLSAYGAQRANSYHVWLTVASQLQASGTDTELRTIVVANAQDQSSSTAPVQCGSTGVIEADIAKKMGATQ